DLMVQPAFTVPVVAGGAVQGTEDDVVAQRIGDMPAVGGGLEGRVRDIEEERVVCERGGGAAVAYLRVIDRDLHAVRESPGLRGWLRSERDRQERVGGADGNVHGRIARRARRCHDAIPYHEATTISLGCSRVGGGM